MTCIVNWILLICRKKNSCMITLYKNGYQMEGKDFCKKEEHKEFYQSLIEGFDMFLFIEHIVLFLKKWKTKFARKE